MSKTAEYYRTYRAKLRGFRQTPTYDHKSGQRTSKFKRAHFIAWDGEGITGSDGVHRYVYLANSLGESRFDMNGLSTATCLEFLLETFNTHPKAIHVCYGASYDVNMLLRDVPWDKLCPIWKNEWGNMGVLWNRYRIMYHHRKAFWIKDNVRKGTLWDVIGFFQVPFVQAIKEHLGADYEDYELIKTNKAKRSQFSYDEMDTITDYCQKELKALVLIMERLQSYLSEAGLQITRWDGAGAIAAALMKRENIKRHMAKTPPTVNRAAQYAYFGGRIEILQYGYHNRETYNYDINSAYPAAMLELPSLSNGRWLAERTGYRAPFSLSHVIWNFTHNNSLPVWYYPFPFREYNGNIYFPPAGEGWYWEPEVSAALDTIEKFSGYPSDYIEVIETINFYPFNDVKPFEFVSELYDKRLEWKAAGNMCQYALKLGLNSLYGKMCQQVGARDSKAPAYHQLEWAGYVTSFARARMLRAACEKPHSIIAFATDGIYATEPLALEPSKAIGGWEFTTYDGYCGVQSGVYWLKNGETWKSYRRGFDEGSLLLENVLAAWEQRKYHLNCASTRFVTLGSGVFTEKQRHHWRTWRTIERKLDLHPGHKRVTHFLAKSMPYKRLERTYPASVEEGGKSAAFELRFGNKLDGYNVDSVNWRIYFEECEDA